MAVLLLDQIYRLKLVVIGIGFAAVGLTLTVLSDWLSMYGYAPHWVIVMISSLSDVALVTGSVGIAVDFVTGRDKEAADTARTRKLLKELTPDFTDAALQGLSASPTDLQRVASPQLLDDIAANAMGLRLGDEQFARELYAEIRDQAIRAPERWYDVAVNVRLSAAAERSAASAPLFDIIVDWEYSTVPSHQLRKFACVSDREEFYELVTEVPSTSTWFMPARTGVDAADRRTFELLEFTVDGEPRPIRRTTRKAGQVYSVQLSDSAIPSSVPVRLRYAFRTVGAQFAHRLFLELPVPARNVSFSVDYTATDIAYMTVTEAVTSLARPRISQLGEDLPGREIRVELPGWLLPRSGLTFVWTLRSEQSATRPAAASRAA